MSTKLVVKIANWRGVRSAANVASCYMVVFLLARNNDLSIGYRKIMKHLQEIFTFHFLYNFLFHPGCRSMRSFETSGDRFIIFSRQNGRL